MQRLHVRTARLGLPPPLVGPLLITVTATFRVGVATRTTVRSPPFCPFFVCGLPLVGIA